MKGLYRVLSPVSVLRPSRFSEPGQTLTDCGFLGRKLAFLGPMQR